MSGLLLRSHVTAGQDGIRDEGSKQDDGLLKATDSNGLSLVPDRSITPSAASLASFRPHLGTVASLLLPVPAELQAALAIGSGADRG
jgi:hypothetical protein